MRERVRWGGGGGGGGWSGIVNSGNITWIERIEKVHLYVFLFLQAKRGISLFEGKGNTSTEQVMTSRTFSGSHLMSNFLFIIK